jgi:hypothetical protein
MFFGLQYVPSHPLYQLQSALGCFFRHCIEIASFDIDCFPEWFRPVLNRSPILRQRFIRIAQLLNGESEETRAHVFDTFQNQNHIKTLCEEPASSLESIDGIAAELQREIKELFYYLYDTTIDSRVFKGVVNGTSIDDHYLKFRELNPSVCPFCGIEDYPDPNGGRRASYDHYLARAHYPFAGVNFENLVPMCESCNESPNKGSNDILFTSPERTARRQVFYPYDEHRGVRVKVSCTEKPSLENKKGRWQISISPLKKKDTRKVETWENVFNLSTRLQARIEEKNEIWAHHFIASHFRNTKCSVTTLRKALKEEAKLLSGENYLRTMSGSVLQRAFLEYLAKHAETEVIESYCRIAQTPYIKAMANTGSSLLRL